MNELDNLVDEIYGAIAKYLTDNLVDIKDVEMGDSVVDYKQICEETLAKMKDKIKQIQLKEAKRNTKDY